MYEEYFGMSKTPFVRNIPADLLYESSSMKDGLGRLKYAADRQLFAVVCSPAGCGKSTLLRKFNDTLSKDKYLVLYISDSKLTPKWLYRSLLDQLGIESSFYRGDSKRLLQKQIEIIREKEKRKVVCILDEAHLLEKETLEEFRFLLNSNYDSESQMCLILAGQTELWENKLRFKRYAAITQRIDINISLSPLSRAECAEYIDTHMKYAGCNTPIFTDKAIDEIYATFYRQTLFAHYEWTISKCVENNEPITYELLSKTMIDLYKQYYDMDIKEEKLKEYVWAYIPHLFYTPFYVYQYATSFAASFALYKNVKDGIDGAFAKYTSLLKSGGSKYPVDQARDAGVDFTKKETFMAVVYRLNELVDELERLISE